MPVGRVHGGLSNQEGMTVPSSSPYDRALSQAMPSLLAQYRPIGKGVDGYDPFGGNVGGFSTLAANQQTVVGSDGYFGDAPNDLQPMIDEPEPWERS